MQRYSGATITGWRAVLVAPLLMPIALVAGIFGAKRKRTADEVAGYLRDFIQETGGEWDWDEFESTPIADRQLDRIRSEASQAGPPNPDIPKLRALLAEAEALARDPGSSASG